MSRLEHTRARLRAITLPLASGLALLGALAAAATCEPGPARWGKVLLGVAGLGLAAWLAGALRQRRWRDATGRLFLALGATVFAGYWLRLAGARFAVNIFDGALFLLGALAPARGLQLYRDLGVVYPPGTPLLFGELLGARSPAEVYRAAGLLVLLLTGLNVWLLVRRVVPGRSRALSAGLYLAAAGVTVCLSLDSTSDLLTPHLLATQVLLLLQLLHAQRRRRPLWAMAAVTAALTLLRWDRGLTFLMVLLAGTAALAAMGWLQARGRGADGPEHGPPHTPSDLPRVLAAAVLAQAAGGLAAVLFLAAWLLRHTTLAQGWEFMVTIPVRIISPYRRLPLPSWVNTTLLESLLFTCTASLLILMLGLALLRARAPQHWARRWQAPVLLLLLPFAMLPYALGRSDPPHFYPLFSLTLVVVVAMDATTLVPRWLTAVALLLPLLSVSSRLGGELPTVGQERCGQFEQSLQQGVAECRTVMERAPHSSLFIGRQDYGRFIVNFPVLYLADPQARPATAFISDEPGLQNSCAHGERVVADLQRAPGPMLALLALDTPRMEPNATASMRSCGRIEAFLEREPWREVGTCTAFGVKHAVRLYKAGPTEAEVGRR